MDIINNKKSLQVYKLASLQVIYVLSTLCGRQHFLKIQMIGVDCGESTPHIKKLASLQVTSRSHAPAWECISALDSQFSRNRGDLF